MSVFFVYAENFVEMFGVSERTLDGGLWVQFRGVRVGFVHRRHNLQNALFECFQVKFLLLTTCSWGWGSGAGGGRSGSPSPSNTDKCQQPQRLPLAAYSCGLPPLA